MTLSLSFDPKQWRSSTAKQRYQLIEQILIRHQRFNTLTAEIDYCGFFANELSTSNPPCIVILGETGAGKTTLIQNWIASTGLTRQETPEGSIIPYLYVFVPAQATIKATASVFLETLGDPNAGRGTQWNMVGRLKKLIKECKVRIIFVDEFQHIVDKDTHHVLHAVADFLKDLINQTNVPMVLIGRIGEAERILTVNPQLDRRVGSPLILEPFAWDRQQATTTILEFRTLMEHIDQALPFDPSDLGEEDMAYRFFYATNGYLGHIMEIIRRAARDAIKAECATLTLPLLATAYDARIARTAMGIGKVNPFTASFTEASAPKVIPAPERTQLPARSGERATTRRGPSVKNGNAKNPKRVSAVLRKA